MSEKQKNDLCPEALKPEKYTIANITQRAVIYDQKTKKFLIAKMKDSDSEFCKKYGPWEFLGGRLNRNEELFDGIKREIEEEAGKIEYEIIDSLGFFLFETHSRKIILTGYLVNYIGGEIELNSEHSEYKWQTAEEIMKDKEYKPWVKYFIEKAEEFIDSQNNIDGWKRCQADFDNYRRRQDERIKELGNLIKEDLSLQILPVIDNFHASIEHIPEDQRKSGWVEGMMHIQRQLESVLSDNGISEIVIKTGDEFNPEIHEAIENHQEKEKEDRHKIKKVVTRGYKLGDKVIRAARVIVE